MDAISCAQVPRWRYGVLRSMLGSRSMVRSLACIVGAFAAVIYFAAPLASQEPSAKPPESPQGQARGPPHPSSQSKRWASHRYAGRRTCPPYPFAYQRAIHGHSRRNGERHGKDNHVSRFSSCREVTC